MNTYKGRFAPSPTGRLHRGSLAAALASWLDARAHGGVWVVRIEDIDPPRDVPGAAEDILRVLTRLGMTSDEPVRYQSRMDGLYEAALEKLRTAGRLYVSARSLSVSPPTSIRARAAGGRTGVRSGCSGF